MLLLGIRAGVATGAQEWALSVITIDSRIIAPAGGGGGIFRDAGTAAAAAAAG